VISDLNLELIDTYRAIQQDVERVIELLISHSKRHCEDYYYRVRSLDLEKRHYTKKAARMIYLNKTCYNGLYRVNRQGKFNVPFGSYKSPRICDEENLREVSTALKNVQLECKSFEDVINAAGENDLVYFDPPYEPISKTANFTAYQAEGFRRDSQIKLSEVCHQLHRKKVKFILSNSSSKRVRDLYTSNGFSVDKVKAIRAINSNPQKRGKLTELIVTNYLPEDA
ncbi:MAG: Dam family site-specific DNA-(adenine-N6)-methyltransferase, partial [Caldithrix sp.]